MHLHLLSQTERRNFWGITIVPWKRGKLLVWDATCPDTYAPSYISHTTREAGAVAQRAEHLNISKYAHLDSSHHFILVAVETSDVFGPKARSLSSRTSVGISGRSQGSQGHWNTFSNESQLLCNRKMQLLFLGQWEGQLDWKLLLAECTLHYLFVCMLFLFLFLSSFLLYFFVLPVLLYFQFFFFFLNCNYNFKLGLSTIIIICTVYQLLELTIKTLIAPQSC